MGNPNSSVEKQREVQEQRVKTIQKTESEIKGWGARNRSNWEQVTAGKNDWKYITIWQSRIVLGLK